MHQLRGVGDRDEGEDETAYGDIGFHAVLPPVHESSPPDHGTAHGCRAAFTSCPGCSMPQACQLAAAAGAGMQRRKESAASRDDVRASTATEKSICMSSAGGNSPTSSTPG